jgi:hypothetical protein
LVIILFRLRENELTIIIYSSAHFGESLAKVMKKMLMLQVAVGEGNREGLGCHYPGRLQAFGWKRKPSWYSLYRR